MLKTRLQIITIHLTSLAYTHAWSTHYKGSPPQAIYNYGYDEQCWDPPCGEPQTTCPEWDTLVNPGPGNSWATPMVAGAAALVKSAYPNMTNAQVMAKLRTSTDPIYHLSGNDSTTAWYRKLGTGRLNAFKAVTFFDSIPRVASDTTLSGTIYVSGDIIVPQGKTLTLAAGTKLKFVSGDVMVSTGNPSPTKAQIIVRGTLRMIGTQSDSIILTSFQSSPAVGDWGGILVAHPGRMEMEFCRISYADTAISVQGDTATVIVYNSTFSHFNSVAVYSRSAKTRLGGLVPQTNPPDCGRNNFLMNTASSGAYAVIKSSQPVGTLKAEGNWWSQAPPQSGWFSGNVDRTPHLTGYATSDSCNAGGQFSQPPPEERVTAIKNVPTTFELGQNYPNPFNPTTTIEYALPQPSRVELKIYNILGQVVRALIDEEKPVGYHQVVWDGKDQLGRPLSSGVYIYKIVAGDFVETKKMHLLK
ncbi:MAG: T9SS type A sorting domain-containing protein [candidate division Zixibacteria bacterium]|nr:T9SS type A sorting domain-containing protein [candidate division Zixibacteria bacterium]